LPKQSVQQALLADYTTSGARASPRAVKGLLQKQLAPKIRAAKALAQRQQRHLIAHQALR